MHHRSWVSVILTIFLITGITLTVQSGRTQQLVYDQPAVFSGQPNYIPYAWTSTYDPIVYGHAWTVYDQFRLNQRAAIDPNGNTIATEGFTILVSSNSVPEPGSVAVAIGMIIFSIGLLSYKRRHNFDPL